MPLFCFGWQKNRDIRTLFYRHPHPGVHTTSVDNDAEKEPELEDMLRGYYEDYVLYIRYKIFEVLMNRIVECRSLLDGDTNQM